MRWWVLGAALFAGACTQTTPRAIVAITAPPVSSSGPMSVDPEAGAVHAIEDCDAFGKRTRAAITTALAKYPDATANGAEDELHTLAGFCAPTHGGAWRIPMPDVASLDRRADIVFAIEAKLTIEHVTMSGVVATYAVETTLVDYGIREANAPVLFDFDGDGEPEIFVDVREVGDEGHRAREHAFVTYKNGEVIAYAMAARFDIDTLEDVDFDGRPDIKIFAGYTDSLEACFSGFPYDHPPARFVAQSLPNGDFVETGEAARRYARAWCPQRPQAIASSLDAVCARLWTKTPGDVTRESRRVAASCVTGWCEREEKQQSQPPNAAQDCGRRQQWFAHEPPFTF